MKEYAFWLIVAGCFAYLAGYSWLSSGFFAAAFWAWSRKRPPSPSTLPPEDANSS